MLLKKFTVLVLSLLVVSNNFALATYDNNFKSKLFDAQERLKNGETHVTIKNIGDDPNKYFELFRYTALDEIVNGLNFENNPYEFVEKTYGKSFNIIENCGTAFGAMLGAGLGFLSWNFFKKITNKNESKKDLKNDNAEYKDNSHKAKNSFIFSVVDLIHIFLFGLLSKSFSSFCLNKFKQNQCDKLEVEKGNAISVAELLLGNIKKGNWKYGDSILIQIDTNIKHPSAVPTMINSNLNYTNEERLNFKENFKNLKQNLEKILKISDQ